MDAYHVAVAALNEVASRVTSGRATDDTAMLSLTGDGSASSMRVANERAATAEGKASSTLSNTDLRSGSSNNSQTNTTEVTTPPTSEGLSSHSQESLSHLSQLSQLAAAQQPIPEPPRGSKPQVVSPVAPAIGQKRTHDGCPKDSSSSSSEGSTTVRYRRGHGRNISALSAGSSMSNRELTAELKTRLSYAMVKVNKGWESLPIDEVESLASQFGSPSSSTSTIHARRNLPTSPRSVLASQQGRHISHAAELNPGSTAMPQDAILYEDPKLTRTYESFWREHGRRQGMDAITSMTPLDLATQSPFAVSTDRRPLASAHQSPVRHATNGSHSRDRPKSSHVQYSETTSAPATPMRKAPGDLLLRTPTQKSLQEQDAIETLLFMSSPVHSSIGHAFPSMNGDSSKPHSPLRSKYDAPLQATAGRHENLSFLRAGGVSAHPQLSRGTREQDIDQMLDRAMANESSEDEIEIPKTPRRLAASKG